VTIRVTSPILARAGAAGWPQLLDLERNSLASHFMNPCKFKTLAVALLAAGNATAATVQVIEPDAVKMPAL